MPKSAQTPTGSTTGTDLSEVFQGDVVALGGTGLKLVAAGDPDAVPAGDALLSLNETLSWVPWLEANGVIPSAVLESHVSRIVSEAVAQTSPAQQTQVLLSGTAILYRDLDTAVSRLFMKLPAPPAVPSLAIQHASRYRAAMFSARVRPGPVLERVDLDDEVLILGGGGTTVAAISPNGTQTRVARGVSFPGQVLLWVTAVAVDEPSVVSILDAYGGPLPLAAVLRQTSGMPSTLADLVAVAAVTTTEMGSRWGHPGRELVRLLCGSGEPPALSVHRTQMWYLNSLQDRVARWLEEAANDCGNLGLADVLRRRAALVSNNPKSDGSLFDVDVRGGQIGWIMPMPLP